jgi:hypothetical protein
MTSSSDENLLPLRVSFIGPNIWKPPQYRPLWFICFPVPFFQRLEHCSQSLTSTSFLISTHHMQKFFPFWSDQSTHKFYCAIKNITLLSLHSTNNFHRYYGLDDRGSRIRFPAGAGNFSLHHRVQNGSGVHPTSYPMDTGGSFPGGKTAGSWSWPLTSI